jgi:two-component system, OmpR family, alkaline phosphatase synthesis response regulator PhoP
MAKRILIIEDERLLITMLKIRLEANNYEVMYATDGETGLKLAQQGQADLIILDLMLPKMDGYKVCRMLKFDAKYKGIPVIILTAKAMEEDKQLGLSVGADAYITKPFEPETLLEKIKELL